MSSRGASGHAGLAGCLVAVAALVTATVGASAAAASAAPTPRHPERGMERKVAAVARRTLPSTAGPHAKAKFSTLRVIRRGAREGGAIAAGSAADGGAPLNEGTITFSEFPDGTSITDQYRPSGILFGGDSPYITDDGANPTSPVLSGTPRFEGTITGTFVTPDGTGRTVGGFSVDVGYINDPGSTEVVTFDSGGDVLDTEPIDDTGIVDVSVTMPGIASFAVQSTDPDAPDGAGFAIDNVTFKGYTFLAGPADASEQGGANNPSENRTTCSTDMPVNCATGVFWHQFTDFSVPGRGAALDLGRTYSSSQAETNGPFGYGWTDSYDLSLAIDASGDATIGQEDGSTVTFPPNGSGGFTAPFRVLATLTKNADGSYTFIRDQGGLQYDFSATGRLTREVDRNGYVTRLAYNPDGQLVTVTDPAGRALSFGYTGSRVTRVIDPMGRRRTYAYDADGNLVQATDPTGRTWSFGYDANHQLLTMTDPRGGTTSNRYNASGQVVSQTAPGGGVTTWSYTGDPESAGGTTTMTDPDGDVTRYQYAGLELLSVIRGYGTAYAATTSYTYDPATLGIAWQIDPDGNVTTHSYDADGNLATTIDPDGDYRGYVHNGFGEIVEAVTPLGQGTNYDYDANGNLLMVTGYATYPITYTYADSAHPGDITSIKDPDGDVTSYRYDSDGDAVSVTKTPSPGVTDTTTYTYDADGERTCAASPDAVAAGIACPAAGTAKISYDADGEITASTDPDGHVTKYAYDGDGNKTRVIDADGLITTYALNSDNQQTTITGPDGTRQLTAYDAAGHPVKQVNGAGDATTYTYDPLGQVTASTDPLGHTTRYGYDRAGNRTSVIDAAGQVTTYAYDADGHETSIGYSDGSTPDVSYLYDADGRRVSMTDGTGTTRYGYDAEGLLALVTNGAGASVSYEYDADGLLYNLIYPDGESITRTYDGARELTAVVDWLGNTTTFSYDHDGNVIGEAYPDGVSANSAYDAADELTKITDRTSSGTLAGFAYARNGVGDITATAETGAVTSSQSYSYTQLSQLASDKAGDYGYNPAGNLTGRPGGVTQAYNADGELTSASVPGPAAPPVIEESVSASQRSKGPAVVAPPLTTKAAGELLIAFISANGPAGKSQKIAGVTGGGLTWSLAARSDKQKGTAEVWQAYAATAARTVQATAKLAHKGYDAAITVVAFGHACGAVGARASSSGASGTPGVSLTTSGADSLVWGAGEDPSHATGRTAASAQTIVGQVVDGKGGDTFWSQRTGTVHAPKKTVKIADTKPTRDQWNLAAVEIRAAAPAAVTTTYTDNKDGDLTGIAPPGKPATALTYDQAGRMTGDGTDATYGYDGDGSRMSKTVDETTTAFAWDQSGSLPLLIAAGATYYVYGPGGAPIEQVDTHSGTVSYLLADQQGSTAIIVGAAGQVTGTYTYGSYGAVTAHTGPATTALQYNGQYTDAESALQYLRARYYDPATGQFLTLDPLVAATGEAYGYAADNPLNAFDPTGLSWYNPFSWSSGTWTTIGLVAGGVAITAATLGVGDLIIGAGISVEIGIEGVGAVGVSASVETTVAEAAEAVSDFTETAGLVKSAWQTMDACANGGAAECGLNAAGVGLDVLTKSLAQLLGLPEGVVSDLVAEGRGLLSLGYDQFKDWMLEQLKEGKGPDC